MDTSSSTPLSSPSAGPSGAAAAGAAGAGVVGGDAVLESLRAFRAEEVRREQAMVLLAVQWAQVNPGDEDLIASEADPLAGSVLSGEEQMWIELAERGCAYVDDLSIPAFAEAAGMTEFQARRLMREALLLVFLLPKVWQAACQGQIEVWRARKLAEDCWGLSPEALAYIDRNMSLATARHTQGGREGIIAEAKLRYMPDQARAEQERAEEHRGIQVDFEDHSGSGIASVWGALDAPDALDVQAAISAGAQAIKDAGSDAPLGVRQAWALGDLARACHHPRAEQTLLNADSGSGSANVGWYHPDCACQLHHTSIGAGTPGVGRPAWDGTVPSSPSKVKMYLHLTPEALTTTGDESGSQDSNFSGVGTSVSTSAPGVPLPSASAGFAPVRVEGNGIPSGMVLSAETVRGWFTRPGLVAGSKVIFRPVMDLHEHQHVEAYEVPERIAEQVALRDGGCVFPWCHRPARHTDCDHTIPWKDNGQGGPTCTCNLAPLCRGHHRAKTHADNHTGNVYTWWNYESLGEGKYLWKGPKGTVLLRTNTGVYDVTDEHLSSGPRTPERLQAPTTVEDVTAEATASTKVSARVSGAQKTVRAIATRLPDADAFDDRFPAPPDEQPFVPPRQQRDKTWRELAPQYDLIEGHSHPGAEPEPSELENLLTRHLTWTTLTRPTHDPPF